MNASGGTANSNVSSTVGVLKMHTSGNGTTTHKIQIQASGSPQIIAASPGAISASTPQVCLDHAGYNSDVDVRSCTNYIRIYVYISAAATATATATSLSTQRTFILFSLQSYFNIICFISTCVIPI